MDNIELFRRIPLFRGLDEKDLAKLAAVAVKKSYLPGDVIFSEGTAGDAMFVINSGTVRILKEGKEREEEIVRMGNGQHFGEMSLLDNETRSATTETSEQTELIRLGREELEKLLAQDVALSNRVYKAFTKYLCGRLRQTTNDLTFMREVAQQRRTS